MDVFFALEMCFYAVSICVYALYLRAVAAHRGDEPFNSSYFTLSMGHGAADLLYAAMHLCRRASADSSMPQWVRSAVVALFVATDGWPATGAEHAQFAAMFWQPISLAVLSANRATSIVAPLGYQRHWTGRRCGLAIALSLLAALGLTESFMHDVRIEYTVDANGTATRRYATGGDYLSVCFAVQSSLMVVSMLLSVAFYAVGLAAYCKLGGAPAVERDAIKTNVKLTACAVAIALSMGTYATTAFVWLAVRRTPLNATLEPLLWAVWRASMEAFTFMNPYSVIVMSKATRRAVCSVVTCGRYKYERNAVVNATAAAAARDGDRWAARRDCLVANTAV